MSIPFEEVIASPTFDFLLGAERKPFTVHESLVAAHSQSLKAMMMGSMAEAKDKCAILANVEPQTFIRFAQFIYTGNYSVPTPKVLIDSPQEEAQDEPIRGLGETDVDEEFVEPEPPTAVDVPEPLDRWGFHDQSDTQTDDWGFGSTTKKAHKKSSRVLFGSELPSRQPKSDSLVQLEFGKRFVDACNDSEIQIQHRLQLEPTHRNQDPHEDMAEIFLAHARVYVFGDTYGVEELAFLAVHKLRQSLSALRLYPQRIGDLIVLIRYSYANTREDDVLRQLVAEYSACMIEYLLKDQKFKELTKEEGPFSADLLNKIMPRLA